MMRSLDMHSVAAAPPELSGGVAIHVEPLDEGHALVALAAGGNRIVLKAAYLTVPYPSGLRRLIAREPALDLILVDHARQGLIEAAAAADIAILDRLGHGRVVKPGFVYVAPAPPGASRGAAPTRSPFAPKASRVVRTMLIEPMARWRLTSLAEQTVLNPGNVHRILAALLETGMVERDEDEYVVSDPGSLLEAWAESHRWPRDHVRLPVSGNLRGTLRDLMEVLDYSVVISGEFAAEAWAPYLPARRALIHCLSQDAWARIREEDSARANRFAPPGHLAEGQLAVVLSDEGVADHAQMVDGLPLAHPVQVYVDLFGDRGRGREAADHVRNARLGY